jgi:hypothetical protein
MLLVKINQLTNMAEKAPPNTAISPIFDGEFREGRGSPLSTGRVGDASASGTISISFTFSG